MADGATPDSPGSPEITNGSPQHGNRQDALLHKTPGEVRPLRRATKPFPLGCGSDVSHASVPNTKSLRSEITLATASEPAYAYCGLASAAHQGVLPTVGIYRRRCHLTGSNGAGGGRRARGVASNHSHSPRRRCGGSAHGVAAGRGGGRQRTQGRRREPLRDFSAGRRRQACAVAMRHVLVTKSHLAAWC